jgi:ribosome-associated translation inhibitor RaiA
MKTSFQFIGLDPAETWCRLVEQQLKNLQRLVAINTAQILLEHRSGITPSVRVEMVLEIAGSDLRAETIDQTRQTALLKATENLERQIRTREVQTKERANRLFRSANGVGVAKPDSLKQPEQRALNSSRPPQSHLASVAKKAQF